MVKQKKDPREEQIKDVDLEWLNRRKARRRADQTIDLEWLDRRKAREKSKP